MWLALRLSCCALCCFRSCASLLFKLKLGGVGWELATVVTSCCPFLTPSCRNDHTNSGARARRKPHMVFARSLLICLLGLAAARKLPYHKGTEHFHQGAHRPACAQPLAA